MVPRLSAKIVLLALTMTAAVRAQDNAKSVYAGDRLVTIDIQLDAKAWADLRVQHRKGDSFLENPYSYVEATVEIDGRKFERVGVRKKGFLGSVVSIKPSLKIRFDKFVKDQLFQGLDQLTLNNNIQDPTHLHQYLAYWLFSKAGAVTPRANFALVTVNGEKLGIYTNVESIRRPFIQRAFQTTKGSLYEGYAGDFDAVEADFGKIVNKWAKDPMSKLKPIQRLGELLAAESIDLEALREQLNLDAFITYWATESLIGHWDSYGGNRNNYYLYRHETTKQLYFIPWGADSVFRDPGPLNTDPVPKSVKCVGLLARRLWSLPAMRAKYQTEMRRLLKEVWIEDEIHAETDRIGELLADHVDGATWERSLDPIHDFVDERRDDVEPELVSPGPDWPDVGDNNPLRADDEPPPILRFEGTFSTKSGAGGAGTFAITKPDGEVSTPFESVQVIALPELPTFIRPGHPAILIIGRGPGDRERSLALVVDPMRLARDKPNLAVDMFAVWAMFTDGAAMDPKSPRVFFGITGEVKIDALDMARGGKIEGSFDVKVPYGGG